MLCSSEGSTQEKQQNVHGKGDLEWPTNMIKSSVVGRRGPPRCWDCGEFGHVRKSCRRWAKGKDLSDVTERQGN